MSGRVVVVGAGIIGAAVALAAVRRGQAVTVIAERPGGDATTASFGWINASWGNAPDYARFRIAAMAEWRAWRAAMPELPVTFGGSLLWDIDVPAMRDFAAERAGQGYPLQLMDRAGARALVPALADAPAMSLHAPDEGAAEPAAVARAMLARAQAEGAQVIPARARALSVSGGAVTGVATAEGVLAGHVVLAAGLGTPTLARSAGVEVPLTAPPGLLIRTRPAPPLLSGLLISPGLHVRQDADGRLIAGGDFGGSDPTGDPAAVAAELHQRLVGLLSVAVPPLDDWSVGQRVMPADGHPILGPVPGVAGLSLAVTHSGVTLAPLVGRLLAAGIGAAPDPALARWGIARFGAAGTGGAG